jgi:hypothetical protein
MATSLDKRRGKNQRRVEEVKMDDYFDDDFGYYDDDPNPYLGTYSEE